MKKHRMNSQKSTYYRDFNWRTVHETVLKLQQEIAAAYNVGDLKKAASLAEQLTRSFAGRAYAVRKVTTNEGKLTPGIDGETWEKPEEKMKAIESLKELSNYRANPVRRVLIDKPNGGKRPLGIPTMRDRAIQTLFNLALLPIAECRADTRSFGFRPLLGARDAVTYTHLVLGNITNTRRWILEADIEKFFDRISHEWLMENIPLKKDILHQFLKAGFMENNNLQETNQGTPQGGAISPTLANLTLDGLQPLLGEAGFLMVRYADDFVVFGKTEEALNGEARRIIRDFLKERGLNLNEEKTKTTTLQAGFTFLGFTFREYPDVKRAKGTKQGIFLATPQKEKVQGLLMKTKKVIREHKSMPLHLLIISLNYLLRGWAEYYKGVTSKKVFSKVGWVVYQQIIAYLKRRFRGVPIRELIKRHFMKVKGNNWVFFAKDPDGKEITLFQMGWVEIKRHFMTRPFNPFLPENKSLVEKRTKSGAGSLTLSKEKMKLCMKQKGICPVCSGKLLTGEQLESHHRISKKEGGKETLGNLRLLHRTCHLQVTHSNSEVLRAEWKDKHIL